MKVSKSDIQKWVKALRSGKYKQTRNELQDKFGHCCLGVACELFIEPTSQFRDDLGYLSGQLPEDQNMAPGWLREIADDFLNVTEECLPELNDGGLKIDDEVHLDPFSFDEIADLLEAVYIHEVLN